jgi:hypothetical protein
MGRGAVAFVDDQRETPSGKPRASLEQIETGPEQRYFPICAAGVPAGVQRPHSTAPVRLS